MLCHFYNQVIVITLHGPDNRYEGYTGNYLDINWHLHVSIRLREPF